ncbi:MAG TPA: glycoside hydrolase family 88 protein, partial [Prolixibacteraceae bacterium]|nr:glycoside hydrolase family 88 protein [Prolixibacteraceae bacterium]
MKKVIVLIVLFLANSWISSGQVNPGKPLEFHSWAKTPPMGWNSWDCFGPTVVESEVRANADYMAANLKQFGWEYIVIDIRWYVDNDKAHGYNEKDPVFVMDEYGRFLPSTVRFPSAANGAGFKPVADYIHSKGLKFGIHIMRGIPKEAVKRNTPVLGTRVKAADIYNTDNLCKWLKDMYTVDYRKEGAQEYYNSLFNLYASWGVDFVKIDDLSAPFYHQEEIEMIRKAIDQSGRKIVLSTSPGETPVENRDHIQSHANMWRIVNDLWDNWKQLEEEFAVCNRWSSHIGEGHFPDCDMLPLGHIGIRAERGNDRMSLLTKDEQITIMTLFSIFRSPLMFGGNLPDNDEFTLSLITNKEVLYVNQHSTENRQLFSHEGKIAWTATDPATGDIFLALFNTSDQEEEKGRDDWRISVNLERLGMKGTCVVKDLWTGDNIGKFRGEFYQNIRPHAAGLYRITGAQTLPSKKEIMDKMVLTNAYFMNKWPDTGKSIVTNRERPSNIWTRAVYYEGLMALYALNPDKAYYEYSVSWGEAHKWGLRDGIKTRNADNQCCGQT